MNDPLGPDQVVALMRAAARYAAMRVQQDPQLDLERLGDEVSALWEWGHAEAAATWRGER